MPDTHAINAGALASGLVVPSSAVTLGDLLEDDGEPTLDIVRNGYSGVIESWFSPATVDIEDPCSRTPSADETGAGDIVVKIGDLVRPAFYELDIYAVAKIAPYTRERRPRHLSGAVERAGPIRLF